MDLRVSQSRPKMMALKEVTEPTFCMNGICCRHSAGLNPEQPGMNDCFHMVMRSVCYCGILSLQLTTASLNYNSLQCFFGETTICFWLFDLVFQHSFFNMNIFRIKPSGGQGGPGRRLPPPLAVEHFFKVLQEFEAL